MELKNRGIYHIKDFDFGNGSDKKDKILIVIHVDYNISIIISLLTTSKQKIPDKYIHNGCTNNEYFSHFLFESGKTVGIQEDGNLFSFNLNTFIYFGDNINLNNSDYFNKYFNNFKNNIKQLAILNEEYFSRLLKCLKGSKKIKFKIKKILDTHLKNY